MSFLSGSTRNIPLPEAKPLGLRTERLATNEQARPVPIFYGTQRLGITFLSQPFDQRAEAVNQRIGKSKQTVGYNYFASFAGLIGQGPADRIHSIYFDNELVWDDDDNNPTLREDSPDYVDLTVEDYCAAWRLYWGTSTQDIDPLLATVASGSVVSPNVAEDHPAYRGQCYFVANQQFIGYGRTNVQNIEVVLSRWPEIAWWPVGLAMDIQDDCNPIACLVDLLQNPRYGLGLANDRLDLVGLEAVARQLDVEQLGISPLITQTTSIRRLIIELLEYVDGYQYTTASGLISVGLARPLAYGAAIAEVDEQHLSARPEIEAETWDQTINRVHVNFSNRDNDYLGDSVSADSASQFAITAELSPLVVERRWFTRPELAEWVARHSILWLSQPRVRGSFRMRASTVSELGLDVGMPFKFSWQHLRLDRLYCRVNELRRPSVDDPEVEVAWENERMRLDGELYVPPTYVAPTKVVIDPSQPDYIRLMELPYNPSTGEEPAIAFLVARKSATTDVFRVNREGETNSYDSLGDIRRFAVRGELNASASAAASSITVDINADTVDRTLVTGSWPAEADSDKYSVLVIDGDGNEELMSMSSCALVTTNRYSCGVLRGRFDTVPRAFDADDEVWIFQANGLVLAMGEPNEDTDTANFKLQAGAGSKLVALADIATPEAFTFHQRAERPWPPTGLTSTPSSFTVWTNFTVEWTNRIKTRTTTPRFPGVVWSIQVRKATEPVGSYAEIDVKPYAWSAHEITTANIQAALGATPVSFYVRVVAKSGSLISLWYPEVLVAKV